MALACGQPSGWCRDATHDGYGLKASKARIRVRDIRTPLGPFFRAGASARFCCRSCCCCGGWWGERERDSFLFLSLVPPPPNRTRGKRYEEKHDSEWHPKTKGRHRVSARHVWHKGPAFGEEAGRRGRPSSPRPPLVLGPSGLGARVAGVLSGPPM